jgi:hypothetical protein
MLVRKNNFVFSFKKVTWFFTREGFLLIKEFENIMRNNDDDCGVSERISAASDKLLLLMFQQQKKKIPDGANLIAEYLEVPPHFQGFLLTKDIELAGGLYTLVLPTGFFRNINKIYRECGSESKEYIIEDVLRLAYNLSLQVKNKNIPPKQCLH